MLKQNPYSNVFQENPIVVKSQYSVTSFISSINKKTFGIYFHQSKYTQSCFNGIRGEFRIFVNKEEKWVEYCKMQNEKFCQIQLLCFADNDNQLLYHRQKEDCIESLTVNQNHLFGVISQISRTIEVFIKLPFTPTHLVQSKDQKLILIHDSFNFKVHLLDIIQKTIVITIRKTQDNDLHLFGNNYLVYTQIMRQKDLQEEYQSVGRKKLFYDIKSMKLKKNFQLQKNTHSYEIDISNQIFNNIGFFGYKSHYHYDIELFKINMVTLKFIRRMKVSIENPRNSRSSPVEFLDISERYLLHRFQINDLFRFNVIDLFNLNAEVFDIDPPSEETYGKYDYCRKMFDNEVLKVEDYKLQQAQFWLTK